MIINNDKTPAKRQNQETTATSSSPKIQQQPLHQLQMGFLPQDEHHQQQQLQQQLHQLHQHQQVILPLSAEPNIFPPSHQAQAQQLLGSSMATAGDSTHQTASLLTYLHQQQQQQGLQNNNSTSTTNVLNAAVPTNQALQPLLHSSADHPERLQRPEFDSLSHFFLNHGEPVSGRAIVRQDQHIDESIGSTTIRSNSERQHYQNRMMANTATPSTSSSKASSYKQQQHYGFQETKKSS